MSPLEPVLRDPLTGLASAALFADRTAHALMQARQPGPVAVLVVQLGAACLNDEQLADAALRLRACLRPGDTAGRLGDREFGVLLDDGADEATGVAGRIVEAIRPLFPAASEVGVAVGHPGVDTAEGLLALARAQCTTQSADTVVADELITAIETGQLVIYYQPTVELATGDIAGAEALVRWDHPTRGLLGPAAFIPIAEQTGVITQLGRWVLTEACREASGWTGDRRVAVNVSGHQLASPLLTHDVANALELSGLAPERLVLELTETVLLHDTAGILARLHELKAIGVRLAVDDFGTGYSSLAYLRHFPFDIVKIDKSFVDELSGRDDEPALARAVVRLGASIGLLTVAEGIERAEQADRLLALGCQLGQGTYFSVPVPAASLS